MMDARIKVQRGDITKIRTEAIVNAANTSLLGGGGVDGAIHLAGGPAILKDCMGIRKKQGGCAIGEAVITTGGNLPAKYVIHTVGPVWNGGKSGEKQLLANAYSNSLQLAVEHGITTIAFPNISTGAYLFPKGKAAEIALKAVGDFLTTNDTIREVLFVCPDNLNFFYYSYAIHGSF